VIARRIDRAVWECEDICYGFFFMVAIDSQMRPIPIPQFIPQNAEEKQLWAEAEAARDAMKAND
jgi:acyl-CoA hydrolase